MYENSKCQLPINTLITKVNLQFAKSIYFCIIEKTENMHCLAARWEFIAEFINNHTLENCTPGLKIHARQYMHNIVSKKLNNR